jgi:hypothetical protein
MEKFRLLSEKIKSYSLFSTALLASTAVADAQIVYTDLEPDFWGLTINGGSAFDVDLNNDGIIDLTVTGVRNYSASNSWHLVEGVTAASGNSANSNPLNYGEFISASLDLVGGWQLLAAGYNTSSGFGYSGPWFAQYEKFLGVRFSYNGEQHYGWMRLTMDSWNFIIYDFAYELRPDFPVMAGDTSGTSCFNFYADADMDGYGDINDAGTLFCDAPGAGFSLTKQDCNDLDALVNPEAIETCNGIDDNCNVSIDEGVSNIYYADADSDGFGDVGNNIAACALPAGYVNESGDCNDGNTGIHPFAPFISWQKSLGGTGDDWYSSLEQTTDGGYIAAGYSYSNDGDVTGNHGGADYWIARLDSSGIMQWQKSLGGTNSDFADEILQTSDGGFIVAGYSGSFNGDLTVNHGANDYWVVKLDVSGNIQWQKSLGGTAYDNATAIQETADGGFIVSGNSNSNNGDVTGNHGLLDYWLVKLDSSGSLQWQKSLGGSNYDFPEEILQTSDGGFIVTGYSSSNDGDVTGYHGGGDTWVVKLDITGNIEWQKSLGGSGEDEGYSIEETADGGFIAAGYSTSNDGDVSGHHGNYDYWVVKLDITGNIEWQKSLGGDDADFGTSIIQTTDGGFIVAGYSSSNDGDVSGNHGAADYWIVKLNGFGSIDWQKSVGGSNDDYGQAFQQTANGGYMIGGSSFSNDGNVSGNDGSLDYWILRLDSSPGGIEICNNLDDNCNGSIDEGY